MVPACLPVSSLFSSLRSLSVGVAACTALQLETHIVEMRNALMAAKASERVRAVAEQLSLPGRAVDSSEFLEAPTESLANSIMTNLGQIEQYMREVLSDGTTGVGTVRLVVSPSLKALSSGGRWRRRLVGGCEVNDWATERRNRAQARGRTDCIA